MMIVDYDTSVALGPNAFIPGDDIAATLGLETEDPNTLVGQLRHIKIDAERDALIKEADSKIKILPESSDDSHNTVKQENDIDSAWGDSDGAMKEEEESSDSDEDGGVCVGLDIDRDDAAEIMQGGLHICG